MQIRAFRQRGMSKLAENGELAAQEIYILVSHGSENIWRRYRIIDMWLFSAYRGVMRVVLYGLPREGCGFDHILSNDMSRFIIEKYEIKAAGRVMGLIISTWTEGRYFFMWGSSLVSCVSQPLSFVDGHQNFDYPAEYLPLPPPPSFRWVGGLAFTLPSGQ